MSALRIAAWIVLWPLAAGAHDMIGALKVQTTGGSAAVQRALAATPYSEVETRSVLSNLRLWPQGRWSKLTVCFVEGSPALRQRVASAMQQSWPLAQLTNNRLGFDEASFKSLPDCPASPEGYAIRVAFKRGDGHWSYVGTESVMHLPSMNFDGFIEKPPPDPEFSRIVAHELGHAIGLEHEHQSPNVPQCGWNFDFIRSNYQWKSEDQMLGNFRVLTDYLQANQHTYIYSLYDLRSTMHYSFPSAAFESGASSPCYTPPNNVPSEQDMRAIRTAYGSTSKPVDKGASDLLLGKFSEPQFAELRQLIRQRMAMTNE